jgi:prolyl-tRNA editing enzyme YbaK/EbsC (Cys-tRNA(Pro) deacylase)
VAAATGASEVRIARGDEVVHATGFEPGGVAPFPQRAVTQTLIDRSFLQHEVVWIGAGTASHMASLAPAELVRLAGARPVDLGDDG